MNIKYRPEIDGLRAIAVVVVILYHAQIKIFGYQPFKGGFIGVDIFFVISGYLITSIILQELVTTGTFSFKHFYERRIRRILPALLFVMLVSFLFAWMYLLPNSFIDYSKSILYSLGFSSNFYFWSMGQEYGEEIGLLFQLSDDFLDIKSTKKLTGKSVKKDSKKGKSTLLNLLGEKKAYLYALNLKKKILLKLKKHGKKAKDITDTIEFILGRNF